MKYGKIESISFKREHDFKLEDGEDRYTVSVDKKKIAEHLRFSELIVLLNMIEVQRSKEGD